MKPHLESPRFSYSKIVPADEPYGDTVLWKTWQKVRLKSLYLRRDAQLLFPKWLGLPIDRPLVQLYRQDSSVTTLLSLVNYLGYFLPGQAVSIVYQIHAYDRNGKKVASGQHELAPKQVLQKPLAEMVKGNLDEYGFFRVKASYRPRYVPGAEFLGRTTAQFMTLFKPTGSEQAPQVIHSHIFYESLPNPFRLPTQRRSAGTEILAGVRQFEYYFLNTSRGRVNMHVELRDAENDRVWKAANLSVPGHGVSIYRQEITAGEPRPEAISAVFTYDRKINHFKPICFRTFESGCFTCNHT